MKMAIAGLGLFLGMAALPSCAQETADYLLLPMFSQQIVMRQPVGWHVESSFRNTHEEAVLLLPPDQDDDNWTEKIQVHAYAGVASHTAYGPDVILRTLAQQVHDHCQAPIINQPLESLPINGYPAVTRLIGCPQLQGYATTGAAQMGFYLAIKGRQDFYVIEHVLHTGVFSPGMAPMNSKNFLSYAAKTSPILLCEPGDTPRQCLQPPSAQKTSPLSTQQTFPDRNTTPK